MLIRPGSGDFLIISFHYNIYLILKIESVKFLDSTMLGTSEQGLDYLTEAHVVSLKNSLTFSNIFLIIITNPFFDFKICICYSALISKSIVFL